MMYILTEEEYQRLLKAGSNAVQGTAGRGSGGPGSGVQESTPEFISHFAFFECSECGRLVAMQKSKKDTPKDLETLAQGCPGCGENVKPFPGSAEQLIKRVLG
ncbi:MAG: hypothetical protein M0021_09435 [Clostridia bacterium]|nr:hypothetical protein [Clostridia bacterium]